MLPTNDFAAPESSSPFEPLRWSQAWSKALFSPSDETFARIGYDPQASIWRAATWIFIATLIGTLIGTPLSLVFNPAQLAPLKQYLGEDTTNSLIGIAGLMVCLVPLGALFSTIGSMIGAGIYQLIAGLMGGRGNFNAMYNAFSAFGAPLGLVSAIISSIPFVNLCLGLPLWLYGVVLSVIAVNGVNRFGIGKAIVTVLVPMLVVGLCCCLASFALGASLAPILGDPANWQKYLTPAP